MRGNKLYKALDGWLGRAGILLLSPFSRGSDRLPSEGAIARILVIKLSALGDTVILIPALQALRERYPDAEIGMVGTGVNREIALEYPHYIDRFFCLDVGRAARAPWTLVAFVRKLRVAGWQLGIDFDQWTCITPLLLRLAGVPRRIGFRTRVRIRHQLYTDVEPRDPSVHEAENFLSLLRPLGIAGRSPDLELRVDPRAVSRCRQRLLDAGWTGIEAIVVLHPGTGRPGTIRAQRAWPAVSYADLAHRLSGEGRRLFYVVTAAPDERDLANSLVDALPAGACSLSLGLHDFIATLSLASLVVSGNSGAMHLAAALGSPQIALHGPAGAGKWGPLNANAVVIESTCPHCPCLDMGWEYHRTDGYCMEQIPVGAVVAEALQLLEASFPRQVQAGG